MVILKKKFATISPRDSEITLRMDIGVDMEFVLELKLLTIRDDRMIL